MNNFEKIILNIISNNKMITDIEFDGKNIFISDNKKGRYILNEIVNKKEAEDYIKQLAYENNKEFNINNPVLVLTNKNLRICAMHNSITKNGLTIHFRITEPTLKIKESDDSVAPPEVFNLLEAFVKSKCNIFICGTSGSGKTELQKFLIKYMDNQDKLILIEDINDTHIKEIYNDKDIFSWNINKSVDYNKLVEVALTNDPDWIIIPEIKNSETYQLIKSILGGHNSITTFHAKEFDDVINRLSFLINEYHNINNQTLEKIISNNIDIIIFMEKVKTKNGVIRRISKIIELYYNNNELKYETIFERKVKINEDYEYDEKLLFRKISDKLLLKLIDSKTLKKETVEKLNII